MSNWLRRPVVVESDPYSLGLISLALVLIGVILGTLGTVFALTR